MVGHTNVVFCVAFSADGHYLASGSGDETIRLWDVTQGFAAVATTTLTRKLNLVTFLVTKKAIILSQAPATEKFVSGISALATVSSLARRFMVIAELCIQLHSLPTGYPLLLAPMTEVLKYGPRQILLPALKVR